MSSLPGLSAITELFLRRWDKTSLVLWKAQRLKTPGGWSKPTCSDFRRATCVSMWIRNSCLFTLYLNNYSKHIHVCWTINHTESYLLMNVLILLMRLWWLGLSTGRRSLTINLSQSTQEHSKSTLCFSKRRKEMVHSWQLGPDTSAIFGLTGRRTTSSFEWHTSLPNSRLFKAKWPSRGNSHTVANGGKTSCKRRRKPSTQAEDLMKGAMNDLIDRSLSWFHVFAFLTPFVLRAFLILSWTFMTFHLASETSK